MRAFVVELSGADDGGAVLGQARELASGEGRLIDRGVGALAPRTPDPARREPADGEPL
jgi:hypothetical protein